MSQLLTRIQAHVVANQAVAAQFDAYVKDIHKDIRTIARSGQYTKAVRIREVYLPRSLEIVSYFINLGYTVSCVRGVLTISWK